MHKKEYQSLVKRTNESLKRQLRENYADGFEIESEGQGIIRIDFESTLDLRKEAQDVISRFVENADSTVLRFFDSFTDLSISDNGSLNELFFEKLVYWNTVCTVEYSNEIDGLDMSTLEFKYVSNNKEYKEEFKENYNMNRVPEEKIKELILEILKVYDDITKQFFDELNRV